MRVPVLIVIPLCLLVMTGVWWMGVRDKDFMTPPGEARLAQVKQEAIASLPEPDKAEDSISPVISPGGNAAAATAGKPALDPGDLTRPPKLDEYSQHAGQGAEPLISLALKLEAEGQFPRALAAWERVIDRAQPNPSQWKTAVSSIERLRPTLPDWNTDPAKADTIILHAGTGKRSAEMLKAPLEAICRELHAHSSGLVNVTPEITAGRSDLSRFGASPVAIWFSGPGKNTLSTEVLSFTFEKADELPSQLGSSIFSLIRGYLSRNTTLTPSPDLPADRINSLTLRSSVTRFAWKNFAVLLNRPDPNAPPEPEVKKPTPPPPAKKPAPKKPVRRRR